MWSQQTGTYETRYSWSVDQPPGPSPTACFHSDTPAGGALQADVYRWNPLGIGYFANYAGLRFAQGTLTPVPHSQTLAAEGAPDVGQALELGWQLNASTAQEIPTVAAIGDGTWFVTGAASICNRTTGASVGGGGYRLFWSVKSDGASTTTALACIARQHVGDFPVMLTAPQYSAEMRSYLDIKFNYELCYRIDQSGNAVGYVLTGG